MSVYFVAAALLVLLLVLWLAFAPVHTAWRRQRLRSQPFPAQWRDILRRRVPYFRQMPVDLQLQLKQHIQVFMAEKPFIGCAGLEVTDDMRVTIAAQACLLLLNRRTGYYHRRADHGHHHDSPTDHGPDHHDRPDDDIDDGQHHHVHDQHHHDR